MVGRACFTGALVALCAATGCSGSSNPGVQGNGVSGESPAPGGDSPDGGGGADDTAPHALGTIALGEAHISGASTVQPLVSVAFVPDASAGKKCTTPIAGCEKAILPKCTACKIDEVCTLDAATCASKCEKTCSTPCAADETCQVEGTKATCKKRESFDAGPVAFSGTTTAITLFPPYRFGGTLDGAPFLASTEIRVQGSGAVGAGFEAFDEKFTSTQFVQTNPPLHRLEKTVVFGKAALPVAWAPGKDAAFVLLAGEGGSLRCKADDAAGKLDVPRDAVKAALGAGQTLSVSVVRERVELRKGKKTKGELNWGKVQAVGWLSLATTSTESASFSCSGAECTGATTCNECLGTTCKTERDACAADATCPALSQCLDACADSACRTGCFATYPDPGARAKNGALFRCQCTTGCATQCAAECS